MNQRIRTALTAVCGIALLASWLVPGDAKVWLAVFATLAGSVFAIQSGLESIKERVLDVNVLMILAAVGAVILKHYSEAAVLLFLFSLSGTLETYALGKTKSAIEGLIKLRPDKAIVVTDSGDETRNVSQISVGDQIRILPFDQVPLDAEIVSGESHVNQAAMTGESQPVGVSAGDMVLAGTQNLEGMVLARVTQASGDTTLEKIVELVRNAQENKASGERVSQWFGQTYTVFVLVAFVLSLGLRSLFGQDMADAVYASLTLLVALSPCALVISTPATTLSALAWAARNGILIRGGQYIEIAGKVDTLFVDKTGTLTRGTPKLAEVCVCSKVPVTVTAGCAGEEACWHGGEMNDESKFVVRAAAAAEQYSTHPVAEAIVEGARQQGIEVPEASDSSSVPGLGVLARVDGEQIKIGQPKFFEELPEGFEHHANAMRRQGMTVAVMHYAEKFAALGLRDEARPEAPSALRELESLGVKRIVMLTGDNAETASAIAKEVGVSEYQAALMPDDKARIVAESADRGEQSMMIGDGINDAPSLARASVGVAMGGLGSDIALNAADIVLVRDRLDQVPMLIKLGKLTNRIVRANLFFAAGVIVFLTVSSFLVSVYWPQYLNLTLPFAVVGHEGSTVLVILNGLRLLRGPQ
ncbi:heavy metal translocating P-type ATPase [Kamptonema cortianum]|nr:heavy metal translocating P-type ATPase [Geitlerinema splendidum]MDK3156897.1 heavy metal translocating P-type ATPase [Kamptonema cortianum]